MLPLSELANTSNDSALPEVEQKFSSFFDKVKEFTADDVICRANCLLCNHPIRDEAEAQFERTNSYTMVDNLLQKYRKEYPKTKIIAYASIRNHLNKHYKHQERQWALREYAEKHNAWLGMKIGQDERFENMITQMEMKLWEIAASDELDLIKQAEAMSKLGKTILEVLTIQQKLRGDLDSVAVLQGRVQSSWVHAINKQTDPEIRHVLLDALSVFESSLQSIQIIED